MHAEIGMKQKKVSVVLRHIQLTHGLQFLALNDDIKVRRYEFTCICRFLWLLKAVETVGQKS